MLASASYAVRYGELSFGDRILDTFAVLAGVDGYGVSLHPSPIVLAVVEIIDLDSSQVLRRLRSCGDDAVATFDRIALDLNRYDAPTFAAVWRLAPVDPSHL